MNYFSSLSDLEARLRRVEGLLPAAGRRLDRLDQAAGALAQAQTAVRNAALVAGRGGEIQVSVTRSCDAAAVAGARVQVARDGNAVGTCTTGADGRCSIAVAAPGDYTVSAGAAGYVTDAATVTAGGTGAVAVGIVLEADADHVCCGPCPEPLPTTLYLTDPYGTIALGWDATGRAWQGCHVTSLAGTALSGQGCPQSAAVATAIRYQLACPPPGGQFVLVMSYACCQDGPSAYYGYPLASPCPAVFTPGACSAQAPAAASVYNPLLLSFPMASPKIYGAGGATITISP
jgi:hypothetical protein